MELLRVLCLKSTEGCVCKGQIYLECNRAQRGEIKDSIFEVPSMPRDSTHTRSHDQPQYIQLVQFRNVPPTASAARCKSSESQ